MSLVSNRTTRSLFVERMTARLAKKNATILAQPSPNVSDSLVRTMDQVANRVGHELKKK